MNLYVFFAMSELSRASVEGNQVLASCTSSTRPHLLVYFCRYNWWCILRRDTVEAAFCHMRQKQGFKTQYARDRSLLKVPKKGNIVQHGFAQSGPWCARRRPCAKSEGPRKRWCTPRNQTGTRHHTTRFQCT